MNDTPYVPPEKRTSTDDLKAEISIIEQSAVMEGLLHSVGGLLAVLDENRHILAINDSFLRMLHISDPTDAMGLRPGEALRCIHSDEMPEGCGTSQYCASCGAAAAIVASMAENLPVERICALTTEVNGKRVDIALAVRSHPINVANRRFLLLFVQDVTKQQAQAALERTFFHDINNILSGIIGASELLECGADDARLVQTIILAAKRLQKEVEIQRLLSQKETDHFNFRMEAIRLCQVKEELAAFFASHPLSNNRDISILVHNPDLRLNTDLSLLLRILSNMVTNALEASESPDKVVVEMKEDNTLALFSVHNPQWIPEDTQRRIFQRNFSTKAGAGRGIGTYSMKLLGEDYLCGKVDFISTPETGTIFRLSLPPATDDF